MGVVTEPDVRAAQVVLDSWLEDGRLPMVWPRQAGKTKTAEDLLELRGLIAAQFAEVRTAGYLEGVQRGRQEAAHVVLDALAGEGLFTTSTRAGEDW